MTTTEKTTYSIDAKGKRLGHVASEIAMVLQGKHDASHTRHTVFPVTVSVTGVDELDISEKKRDQKIYKRYSGYPGGQTEEPMKRVLDKKGTAEVLKKAVYGMLPGNKLRNERMKNLKFE